MEISPTEGLLCIYKPLASSIPLMLVRQPKSVRKKITGNPPEAVKNVLLHSGRR